MRQTEIDVNVPDVGEVQRSMSVTALRRFWRCPLAFWISRVAGKGAPVSAGDWSLGQIVHGTLQRLFDLPPQLRTYDALFGLVLAEWRVEHPTAHFDYLYLARSRAAGIFDLMDAQRIDVRGTEVTVESTLAGFTIRGRIDLLYRDVNGANVIADFKSAFRPPRSPLQDPILALRTYDLLLSERYSPPETETELELLILDPPDANRVGPIGLSERHMHLAEVTGQLETMAASAASRIWVGRVRPSCQGCAFFAGCPAVAAARRPKSEALEVTLSVDGL